MQVKIGPGGYPCFDGSPFLVLSIHIDIAFSTGDISALK
jgi:hypothetical protein